MKGICYISFDDYLWDANGNINKIVGPRRPSTRAHYFNEENRLAAKSDWPGLLPFNTTISSSLASYLYSADGERVWKFAGTATMTYSNGQLVNSDLEMDKTFYPTPQTTFDKHKFYKHYFIGSERICTQVTQYVPPISTPNAVGFIPGSTSDFMLGMGNQVKHSLDSVGYSGNIAIDPDFNCITTSPYFRTKTYYYHYNHQGSVSLVTYQNGTLQQHLQYFPYGGTFVDHRTGSYSSTYTFSAKEKDSESGYTYFGARYYSDNIMQWLSVDPMSDMRPGVSPYSYCQNNPIGRIDPSGALDEGYITGTAAKEATEQLRQAAPNLDIQRDEESGKLSYSGTAITKAEKKIAQAIDDKNVIVNINAENSETFVHKGEKVGHNDIGVGAFMGNELIKSENGTMIVNTYQQVNPERSAYYDKETGSNGLMGHELLESYFGGVISLKLNSPAYPARQGTVNKIYDRAHNMANRYFLGGIAPKMETKQVMCKDIALPYYRQEQVGWVKTK